MSFIAGSETDVKIRDARRQFVPLTTTILACLLSALPIVTSTPVVPDFGFLVLISWRLLRPEMWTATTALPLGLFNDMIAGHPIGQSMALWTIAFIVYDMMDTRLVFRDYIMDWLVAAVSVSLYICGEWYIGHLMGNRIPLAVLWPQMVASVLTYPLVARIVLTMDRWRLSR